MLKQNIGAACSYFEADGLLDVRLSGDIDHHSSKQLRKKIDEAIYLNKPTEVRLDFSGVDFMDSSGLGLILGRSSLAEELGGRLVVVNPTKNVEKILSLAGLERIVAVVRENNGNK